jgi:hypothetical protein
MCLGNNNIEWVDSIKYLDVYIACGKKLTFDTTYQFHEFSATDTVLWYWQIV